MTIENMQENNLEIKIEKQTEEDLFEVQELLYKTWLDTYPNEKVGITREDIDERYKLRQTPEKREASLKWFRERPVNIYGYVAKIGDKVVGACSFVQNPEFDQLQMFYVLPEFQRQGIAKKMWQELQKLFMPGKRIIVQVADYNEKAIKYYEKLGFKDNGKRFSDPMFTMPISGKMIPEMEMEMIA